MNNIEWTIIGLLADRHRTGYDVLKVFRESPAFPFRSSSGSVYPALKRLVRTGFAAVRGEETGAGRRTVSYEITSEGRRSFAAWLVSPISRTLPEATTDTLLRLLFSHHGPPGLVTEVLQQYRALILTELTTVKAALAACDGCLPETHRYCLLNGTLSLQTQLDWANQLLAAAGRFKSSGGDQP